MSILRRFYIVFISLLLISSSYAQTFKFKDLIVKTEIKGEELKIFSVNNGKNILIDSISFSRNITKINFIYNKKINSVNYLIISASYPEDYRDETNTINYDTDINFINAYRCSDKCIIDDKLSNYFGNGANIINHKK